MIVVDASALVELLLRTPLGQRVTARLFERPVALHAPHLIDIEVIQVLRRFDSRGEISAARSTAALAILAAFPMRRHSHEPLMSRIWTLRDNVTAYDAAYVALAEALGGVLLTCDARLGRASGIRATVEVLT